MTKLLTTREVAERLSCAPAHVSRLCSEGRLRASKIAGWRVSEADLEAFIASRRPVHVVAPQPSALPALSDNPYR
jgi:excisionase family DNA binding protein